MALLIQKMLDIFLLLSKSVFGYEKKKKVYMATKFEKGLSEKDPFFYYSRSKRMF